MLVEAATRHIEAARQESEMSVAKMELAKRHQGIAMRLTTSAMASTKRSIDNQMKVTKELGTDNKDKTAIRDAIDKLTPAEVKDKLALHPFARLTGGPVQCKHRLQQIECGEHFPVEEDTDDDDVINRQNDVEEEEMLLKQKAEIEAKLKLKRKSSAMVDKALEPPNIRELTIAEIDKVMEHLAFHDDIVKIAVNQYIAFRVSDGKTPGMLRLGYVRTMESGRVIIQRLEQRGVPLKQHFDVCLYTSITEFCVLDNKKHADDLIRKMTETIKTKATITPGSSVTTTPCLTPRTGSTDSSSSGMVVPRDALGRAILSADEWTLAQVEAALTDESIEVYSKGGILQTGSKRQLWLGNKKRRF